MPIFKTYKVVVKKLLILLKFGRVNLKETAFKSTKEEKIYYFEDSSFLEQQFFKKCFFSRLTLLQQLSQIVSVAELTQYNEFCLIDKSKELTEITLINAEESSFKSL